MSSITPRPLPDLSADDLAGWMVERGYKGAHASRVLRELYAVSGPLVRESARMPPTAMDICESEFEKKNTFLIV